MIRVSDTLIQLLKKKPKVAVLTGAGISAESGVPTFRDPDGLWAKFKPEELASFHAFMQNPKLVWEWYQHRIEIVRKVEPNPGHFALQQLESFTDEFTLVTQNVDNLHCRAGSKNIIEIHGNIDRNFCIECGEFGEPIQLESLNPNDPIPKCTKCKGSMRPDVVWFGESLPEGAFEQAESAARNCDLFFSIGTSGAVYPAALLPSMAKQSGAYVVEVNKDPSEISDQMDENLFGYSGEILPQLIQLISKK